MSNVVDIVAKPFKFVGRLRRERTERKEKLQEIEMLKARFHPENITKEDLMGMFASRDEAFDFALSYSTEVETMMPYAGDLAKLYLQ